MTPEELEILEALEAEAKAIGDLYSIAGAPPKGTTDLIVFGLQEAHYVEHDAGYVTLTRAGREVLALRRKLAEVEV
jgi:hypothetical protein